MEMFVVESQRVLITGVSSGVGLATAKLMAEQSYTVVGTARTAAKAADAMAGFADRGFQIDIVPMELSDAHSMEAAIEEIRARGPIDTLVNNAGLAVYGPIDEADDAAVALQFAVNVLAPIRLIRAFAPAMRARGRGAIVNISSGSGFLAQPYDGLYAASKHALEGLTEALHWEMRPYGVRVASIQLGRFDTPIRDKIILTEGFGPASAHWSHFRRFHDAMENRLWRGAGEPAERAAEAILHAITTDEPQLRWLVGPDVEAAAKLRTAGPFELFERTMRQMLQLDEVA